MGWSLFAQDLHEDVLPDPPAGRILVEGRLFQTEPDKLSELSARLTKLSERTGYETYVVIYDSLLTSDVKERSRRLQRSWIGDRPGVVLVVESDSLTYDMGWVRTPPVMDGAGEPVAVMGESDLAPQEQIRIINAMAAGPPSGEERRDQQVESLLRTFVTELERSFRTMEAEGEGRWNVRVLVLGVGLMATMILIALLVGAWMKRSERRAGERLVFPGVTVGMRLGAPCGGGKISSRSFSVRSSDEAGPGES